MVRRAALAATTSDLLARDGVILGTPANIGYMSRALKHFFDQVFYVVNDVTPRAPGKPDLEACRELGATVAATLAG